jgi:glycosyltransferase involved in cell wall biosynthesis
VKRKILIIVENIPVPFDPRVWKEGLALREADYEVSILSPKGKGYEDSYELREGIHIYRHPLPKEGNSALGYLWEYGWALFWETLFAWWIYFRRGFDVIQACNPPDDIFLVAWPFKLFGVKFIFDHHDVNPELYLAKYEREDFFYKAQLWLEKMTFRVCDVVMSTNESYKEIALTRGGVPPDSVFVVRNGPDLRKFKAVAPNPALKYGKRYLIGYVGVMSSQEGLDILLEVAERIRNLGRDDVHFTCVGSGPSLLELRQAVLDKNLGDVVNFTGRISDADLLAVLSTADVCVNPDKPCKMNDMSTMIKIMEYMALGKPIVQFDLREGKISAQAASLYSDNENQVADFAANVLWLLDHPEERRTMGEFGRRRVETELAWEYSVKNLLAAYDKAFTKIRGKRAYDTGVASSCGEDGNCARQ